MSGNPFADHFAVMARAQMTSACLSPLRETGYAFIMDILGHRKGTAGQGFLENQFLIAMPGMQDERFERSVVYLCAHSEEGAMGLIVNQPQQLLFPDLLVQLDVLEEEEAIRLPEPARSIIIRNGGPVDRSRGFVLHSDDYMVESSLPVAGDVCLIRKFVDFAEPSGSLAEAYHPRPGSRVNFSIGDGVVGGRGGSFGFNTNIRASGSLSAATAKAAISECGGLFEACGYEEVVNTSDLTHAVTANTTTSINVQNHTQFRVGMMVIWDGNPTIITDKPTAGELTVSPALPKAPGQAETLYATRGYLQTDDGDEYGCLLEWEVDGVRTTMTGCKGNVVHNLEGDPPQFQWSFSVDNWFREIEAAPYIATGAYSTAAPALTKDRKVYLSATGTDVGSLTASLNAQMQPKEVQGNIGNNGRIGYQVAGFNAGGSFQELLDAATATLPQETRWTARTAKDLIVFLGSHGTCFGLRVPVARHVESPHPHDRSGMGAVPSVFQAQDAGTKVDPVDGVLKNPNFAIFMP